MKVIEDLLTEENHPVIVADKNGIVTHVNAAFERQWGWKKTDLVNRPITAIIPTHMRETHHAGFSRFLTTGKPTLMDQPLQLPILCGDGQVVEAEHRIVADKKQGDWRFAAMIRLKQKAP